jgi:hypothetical protein
LDEVMMIKARHRERQKRQRAEFVTDEEQRQLEIEDMRLVVKFGDKRRYSDREREAIRQELVAARLDPCAARAVRGIVGPTVNQRGEGDARSL